MATNPIIQTETANIKRSLGRLRKHFEAGTPDLEILSQILSTELCSPATVYAFAKKEKTFTTADVMQHFQVSKYKVAGSLAALARSGDIEAVESKPEDNGYSRYRFVNRKS